ncbi:unnamed protein product, partial [Dicrocoelium dendriticum]
DLSMCPLRSTEVKKYRSETCLVGFRFYYSTFFSSRDTNCQARVNLIRTGRKLKVTTFDLSHNHPVNRLLFERHPINRRLTDDEFTQSVDLFRYNTPTSDIKQFVEVRFGKHITSDDIRNVRRKLRPGVELKLPQVIKSMEEDGVARIISEEGLCTHVLFARHQQIELFRRFSHVVCVDATHGTNRLNFKLYQFLITDGMGYGRPIFYAFLRREDYASLLTLFEAFRDIMGHDIPVRTIMMDKMAAQIRAARAVFQCDILLCYFHIRQAIRKHTNINRSRYLFHRMATSDTETEFQQDLKLLQRTDPHFVRYLTLYWLYIKRSWAKHAQAGLVHFGNTTNNRVENANLRLKKVTHASDGLVAAVRKVWAHSEVLLKESQMHAAFFCDRRQLLEGSAYVHRVVCLLTTYACNLVMRHLAQPMLQAVYSDLGDGVFEISHQGKRFTIDCSLGTCTCPFYETMWLPCVHLMAAYKQHAYPTSQIPICIRWLADYNLPTESMPLRTLKVPVTKPSTSKIAHLVHRLRSAEEVNPSGFSVLYQELLRMTNEVIGDSSDFLRAKKQPRWPKIMAATDLCFTCSKPVVIDAVRCAHNRLLYHRKCLRVQSGARCTICVNASQTVSVPMMAMQCCTTAVGRSPSPDFTVASTPSTCPAYENSQDEITADPSTSQQTVPHIARALGTGDLFPYLSSIACRKGAVEFPSNIGIVQNRVPNVDMDASPVKKTQRKKLVQIKTLIQLPDTDEYDFV